VKQLNADITELDPEISDIIEHEKNRQWKVWGILINVCIGPIFSCRLCPFQECSMNQEHVQNKTNVMLRTGWKHVQSLESCWYCLLLVTWTNLKHQCDSQHYVGGIEDF